MTTKFSGGSTIVTVGADGQDGQAVATWRGGSFSGGWATVYDPRKEAQAFEAERGFKLTDANGQFRADRHHDIRGTDRITVQGVEMTVEQAEGLGLVKWK